MSNRQQYCTTTLLLLRLGRAAGCPKPIRRNQKICDKQTNVLYYLYIYIYSNMWQKDRVIGQPKPIVTICVKYLTSNSENGTHSKHQKDRQVIYHITTMFVSILLFYFLWLLHAISATSWKGCYMPFRPHLERRKIPCHGGLRLHLYPLGYRVKGEDKRWPWASWFHSASCSINVCRATLMIYVWNKTCFFCFGQTALFPDHAWLTQCVLPNVDISCEVSDARARRNLEAYYIHVGECICIYVYYSSLSIQTYRI